MARILLYLISFYLSPFRKSFIYRHLRLFLCSFIFNAHASRYMYPGTQNNSFLQPNNKRVQHKYILYHFFPQISILLKINFSNFAHKISLQSKIWEFAQTSVSHFFVTSAFSYSFGKYADKKRIKFIIHGKNTESNKIYFNSDS